MASPTDDGPVQSAPIDNDHDSDDDPTDDPDTSSWKVYSPVPFRGCAASKFMDRQARRKVEEPLRKVRCGWWALVLAVYLPMQFACQNDTDVTSAVHAESVDEFFPDAGKASERLKESEVTAGLKEELHADDVAQTLNWYTTFCKDKQGTDDHVRDTWECELTWVEIGDSKPQKWDAAHNRGLFKSDNPSGKDPDPSYIQQSLDSIDKLCSKSFLMSHVGVGDDPIAEADFGDVDAFQRKILNSYNISHLSADYDEFTVLGHNAMFDDMADQEDKHWGLRDRLEKLEAGLKEGLKEVNTKLDDLGKSARKWGATRLERRLGPEVMSMLEEGEEEKEERRSHRRSRPWIPSGFAQRRARLVAASSAGIQANRSRAGHRRGDDDEEDGYGVGCFERSDIIGFLRDKWMKLDIEAVQPDNLLNAAQASELMADIFPKISDAEREAAFRDIDAEKSGNINFFDFLSYVRDHRSELEMPGRGALMSACKNHHWGLISLCKPTSISASYTIKNVERLEGDKIKIHSEVEVHIRFYALGEAKNSGWYKAEIDIRTEQTFGKKPLWSLLSMNVSLLVMVFLFWDPLLTLALLPYSTWRVLNFRLCPGLTQKEACLRTYHRMCRLVDARLTRILYLDPFMVMVENAIAMAFVYAVTQAVREAFRPSLLVGDGNGSLECYDAFFQEARKRQDADDMSPVEISPLSHIKNCMNLTPLQRFIEIEFELIFTAAGGAHSAVLAMIWLRCFAFLDMVHRLRWLPATLRLCRNKLLHFIFVYILLVAGFSVAMTFQFGGLYVQYSSFPQAFFVLLMFSFGHSDRAVENLHPWVETTGTEIAVILLIFEIIVVAIGLQFFTTIVLNAYVVESDKYEDLIEADFQEHIGHFARLFGQKARTDSEKSVGEQRQEAAPAPQVSQVG